MEEERVSTVVDKKARRKYEDAFSSEDEVKEAEEVHIVPEATKEFQPSPEQKSQGKSIPCQVPSCLMTFKTVQEYQDHYGARHMHACQVCRKSLPSARILEIHVLETHDSYFALLAERKPMLQCFMESCAEKFSTTEERKSHCMDVHKFSKQFPFWDAKPVKCKNSGSAKGKKDKNKSKEAVKSVKDVEMVETDVPPLENDPPEMESGESNGASSSSKSKANSYVPKHLMFGHSSHKAFKVKNAYATAVSSSGKQGQTVSDIDMKDVEKALLNGTSDNCCNNSVEIS